MRLILKAIGIFSLVLIIGMVNGCVFDRKIEPPKGRTSDQLYKEGMSQLKTKDYRQAVETFYKLKYDYPTEAAAMLADLKIADAYFSDKKYTEAIESYEDFRKMHPASPYIPYAVYMLGLCHYERMYSIDRDQTNTERALSEFKYLLTHFPNTPYAWDASEKIKECMQRLSDHEIYVGSFYYRMKKYRAAIQRFEAALTRFPSIPFPEDALFDLGEAYRRTEQYDKAQRTWQALVKQYPKSKSAKKARSRLAKLPAASATLQASLVSSPPTSSPSPPSPIQPSSLPSSAQAPPPAKSQSDRLDQPPKAPNALSSASGSPPQPRPILGKVETNSDQGPPQSGLQESMSAASDTEKILPSRNVDEFKIEERDLEPESRYVASGPKTPESNEESPQAPKVEKLEAETVSSPPEATNSIASTGNAGDSSVSPKTQIAEGPKTVGPAESVNRPVHGSSQEAVSSQDIASRAIETAPAEKNPDSNVSSSSSDSDRVIQLARKENGGNTEPRSKQLESPSSGDSQKPAGFGELRKDQPINITADRMDAFQKGDKVIFEGNVVVNQENTYIFAQHITAELAPEESGGGLRHVVAVRDVRITKDEQVATCERAEFDNVSRTINLLGNPRIWQGKDHIDGERVVVHLDQEKMTVVGSEDKRVSAVLYPKDKKASGDQKAKTEQKRPSLSVPFAATEEKTPRTDSAAAASSPAPSKAQGEVEKRTTSSEPILAKKSASDIKPVDLAVSRHAPKEEKAVALLQEKESTGAAPQPSEEKQASSPTTTRAVQKTSILDQTQPTQSSSSVSQRTDGDAQEPLETRAPETAVSLGPEDEAAKIASAALQESAPRRSRSAPPGAQEKKVSASRPDSEADLEIRPSVEKFIGKWRKAWESKELDMYMSFYSQRFHSGKRDWNAWRDYKASLNRRYNSIRVEMEDVKISQDREGVKVSFIQRYRSDRYQDLGKKTLKLVKEDGQWKILQEDWRAL